MANDDEAVALGRRVKAFRTKLGLSQAEFAKRVDRSETWLSQVERGARKIDRMSVLERLAAALDVPIAELAPESNVVTASERPKAATDIALTLSSSTALAAILAERSSVDVGRLNDAANKAWELAHASRYEELAGLLTEVLPTFERAVRDEDDTNRSQTGNAGARLYYAVSAVLAKLGEHGAAWVAVDRAIWFAEMGGDPLLMGEGAFRLSLVLQASRRFDLAKEAARSARAALDTGVSSTPEAASVRGALTLQLAVISARLGEADEAYRWLSEAEVLANELGADRNDYNTEFGPTNVRLHEVAIAVELGDAGRAIRVAEATDAAGLSPERRGRLLIDVGRAHAQRRQIDGVVNALTAAFEVAPQQVSTHPLVRDLLAGLLSGEHASNPDLQDLHRRLT